VEVARPSQVRTKTVCLSSDCGHHRTVLERRSRRAGCRRAALSAALSAAVGNSILRFVAPLGVELHYSTGSVEYLHRCDEQFDYGSVEDLWRCLDTACSRTEKSAVAKPRAAKSLETVRDATCNRIPVQRAKEFSCSYAFGCLWAI